MSMAEETGLRERKKRRTREAIGDAAFELFAARGFDNVTVAEIARRADVSEATVFNHYPTKEDLVYGRFAAFEDAMLDAIRQRPPGRSVLAAFREFILGTEGQLHVADPEARDRLTAFARIIAGSPALLARERRMYDEYTRVLAEIVADGGRGDDVLPWVVANAVLGIHRSLIEFVRAQLLAGRGGPALARRVRAQATRAIDLLEHGISD